MIQLPKYVLSCDWGTSSFRLRLIDTDTLVCLARVESNMGNAVLFNQWKQQQQTDRVAYFADYLNQSVEKLSASTDVPLDDLIILISGMASSSIGIKELPYTDLPFALDGGSAYAEWIDAAPIPGNPILLISGVQQSDDVMRGEETQLAGISSFIELPAGELLFILPGTHSKHISVSNNQVNHFKTFMTGEIFQLLTKHSILSHAVASSESNMIADEEISAFCEGVKKALSNEMLNALFSVRVNHLKNYFTLHQNYFYLSGLLIGSEIKYLKEKNTRIILCSTRNLQNLYQLAIDTAELSHRTTAVSPETLDNAATAGQLKVLQNLPQKNK